MLPLCEPLLTSGIPWRWTENTFKKKSMLPLQLWQINYKWDKKLNKIRKENPTLYHEGWYDSTKGGEQ